MIHSSLFYVLGGGTRHSLTPDGEHGGSRERGHLVGGHAAVVARVLRLQEGDGEHGGELVDAPDGHGARGRRRRQERRAVLAPCDLQRPVALRHRAHGAEATAAGQVLREAELLHEGGHWGACGGGAGRSAEIKC